MNENKMMIGDRVIMVSALDYHDRLLIGSRGVVTDFFERGTRVCVKFDEISGCEFVVNREFVEVETYV